MATVPSNDRPRAGDRGPLADRVHARLKADIFDFRLMPGDRIFENEVAAQTGASRTPVREALFRLERAGYVRTLARGGWQVAPLDFDTFEQLYDVRTVLECAAVRRLCEAAGGPSAAPTAAGQSPVQGRSDEPGQHQDQSESQRPGNADRDSVEATLADLKAVWQVPRAERRTDATEVWRLDERFHARLVAAAGNAEMTRIHGDVTERIRIIRRLDFTEDARITATYDEHAAILEALGAGQAEQAAHLLAAHIRASRDEVRQISLYRLYEARRALADASASAAGADP